MKEYIKPECINLINDVIASTCIDITSTTIVTSLETITKGGFNFEKSTVEYVNVENPGPCNKTSDGYHWHAQYTGPTDTQDGFTFTNGVWYDFCDLTKEGSIDNFDFSKFTGTICVCESPNPGGGDQN